MTVTPPLRDLASGPTRTRPPRRRLLSCAGLLTSSALAGLLAVGPAGAQTLYWTGAVDDDWDTAGNWGGLVPTASHIVIVNSTNPVPVIGPGVNGVASHVFVGQDAAGGNAIIILGGGTLTSASTEGNLLGLDPGSNGEILVSGAGSQWTSNGLVVAGVDGRGVVFVSDSGRIDSTGTQLAFAEGSTALVNLSGAGSQWINTGVFVAGISGDALAFISSGAYLENTDGIIAAEAGSSGRVTVSGGSHWSNNGTLIVAIEGEGSLNVHSGGIVDSQDTAIGGGSTGSATVSGAGSQLNAANELHVGWQGNGTLDILSGGTVSSTLGFLGRMPDSRGEVSISGAGSSWTATTGNLFVGLAGEGRLSVSDNGQMNVGDSVFIGFGDGSIGEVILNDAVMNVTNDLFVGGFGAGTLIADNNTTMTIGGGLYIVGNATLGMNSMANVGGVAAVSIQPGTSGPGGRLLLEGGSLSATGITIAPEGWVGGSGALLSPTTVAGTISPGNSIGSLAVFGAYTQESGSTYVVEGNAAGQSDFIIINGTATLNGGTVQFVPFPDFAIATPYTILTAVGGVTGTYDDMTALSAFLLPTLTYDANNVFLTLTALDFATAAMTPNQIATAGGAQSLGSGNAVYDAILLLGTQQEAQAAFDALSGEVHASIKTTLVDDSGFLRAAATSRIRAAFGESGAGAAPVLAYGPEGRELVPADAERFAVWGQGFGAWGRWESDGNAAALDRSTGGLLVGGDMAVAENWRLGLLAGYSHAGFSAADRASSGSTDSFHLGIYGGGKVGDLGLRFGGAHTWHGITTTRAVSFPGFTDTLSASYGASTTQLFAEAGYKIETARARFEPFAGLAYVHQRTDGFTETGGAGALTAAASAFGTVYSTLGIRAETDFMLGGMSARAHGSLGWRHAFGPAAPTASFSFAGGSPFTIAGVPIARDAALIEAGLSLDLSRRASMGLAYDGQFGSGAQSHGLRAVLSGSF